MQKITHKYARIYMHTNTCLGLYLHMSKHLHTHTGSCYAFAAAGALSARMCAKSGGQYNVDISPQQMLSCNGKDGCQGGNALETYEQMYSAGVLQCVAMSCSVLHCVAVCCTVLQCVAGCCSVLQCERGNALET